MKRLMKGQLISENWYWCVWKRNEIEAEFTMPMKWVDGDWHLPHGLLRMDKTTPVREPDAIFGPIEVPDARQTL